MTKSDGEEDGSGSEAGRTEKKNVQSGGGGGGG